MCNRLRLGASVLNLVFAAPAAPKRLPLHHYQAGLPCCSTRHQSPEPGGNAILSLALRLLLPISQPNLPISPRPPTSVSPHSAHRLISSSNLSLLCVSACVLRFACRIFTPFGSVCRYAHSITDTPAPRTATFFFIYSGFFLLFCRHFTYSHTYTHTHRGTYTDTDCSPAIRARTRWQTATKKRAARK